MEAFPEGFVFYVSWKIYMHKYSAGAGRSIDTHTHPTFKYHPHYSTMYKYTCHEIGQSYYTESPPLPDSAFDTFKLKMLTQGESFTKLLLLYHLLQLLPR